MKTLILTSVALSIIFELKMVSLSKRFVFLFIIFLIPFALSAQKRRPGFLKRYMTTLINDTSDIRNPQFLIYPTVAYAPETSWEFGLSSIFVFYANRDTTNRLSEVNAFTFTTLERQYGLWFDHAFYSQDNLWFSLGRLRLQSFPMLYFGIGINTPEEHIAQVNANLVQIRERVLRKIFRGLYGGLEVDYQNLSAVNFIPTKSEFDNYPTGSNGSANLGLGAGFLYDTRNNILNVRRGLFSEFAFLHYDHSWGSDFKFTSFISDTRLYKSINSRDVIAFQLLGQFNVGNTPFNQLAMLGGESMMRGYYAGRYRNQNQIAMQAEYRFLPLPLPFTKRIGAAVFAGTATVYNERHEVTLGNFVWAAGGGLRFFLFPKKDVFTRLDFAFTEEGTGFYFFIGEAF